MPGLKSASIGIWIKAGGRHESIEQNGVAHFLEHMAFKGTKRRSSLQIAEAIEDVGGYINAYTSREMTAYYARVLSDDVFVPELGLLIVDEEHRFGVGQKEKIRSMKQFIDVLMLSATPIPRTLQHSLVGIKDISLIQTPPKSRKPIETAVRFFDWDTICLYIDRELSRDGQVYFLHNDINSLPFVANKIRQFFPGSTAEVVHGQLPGRELEKRILAFFGGKIDILVCTTIIESGIDVSNANSIVINDAQNFGLSQLYQIRGRVGRWHN